MVEVIPVDRERAREQQAHRATELQGAVADMEVQAVQAQRAPREGEQMILQIRQSFQGVAVQLAQEPLPQVSEAQAAV